MTARQGFNNFGITNIITIAIMLGSIVFNYAVLSTKMDNIADRLQGEVVERKLEDEKLRLEINNFYSKNDEQHQAILIKLDSMQEDLTFHLGKHAGTEDPLQE